MTMMCSALKVDIYEEHEIPVCTWDFDLGFFSCSFSARHLSKGSHWKHKKEGVQKHRIHGKAIFHASRLHGDRI